MCPFEDIQHYQKIVFALSETSRIMKEIDTIEIELGNVLKNSWWFFSLKTFNCVYQLKEEVGSAGEQPASN